MEVEEEDVAAAWNLMGRGHQEPREWDHSGCAGVRERGRRGSPGSVVGGAPGWSP